MLRRVYFVGRTGDGKSAACTALAKSLGHSGDGLPFSESAAVTAHTHQPVSFTVGDIDITDTPGLMDTNGVERDEMNLRMIVDKARAHQYFHAMIIVINHQAQRFDAGMQDAVKLLVDSFGAAVFGHMGILFTRCFLSNPATANERVNGIRRLISERTGIPVGHLPFWQTDAHPEALALIGGSADHIANRVIEVNVALQDCARWIQTQNPLPTDDAVYGEYVQRQRAREAEIARAAAEVQARAEEARAVEAARQAAIERQRAEAATASQVEAQRLEAEAIARANEERRKREYDISIIRSHTENHVTEVSRVTTPVFSQVQRSREVWKNKIWGAKRTENYTETVHTGNVVTVTEREERRTVDTLGSGQINYGNWVLVREWQENV
jgi:hypothetical protein